ncbi:enoyl-CoA hydratase-related protein [Methylobacterium fujisawaense]|uniref:enoyl-CoA hydratase-related protein n=1 Tax=Methylobacterium fujisawaense TaxID=107400 RepID=UPI002F354323
MNIRCLARGGVCLLILDRPRALNALSDALIAELGEALDRIEADDAIGCVVLTGSREVFAAGADIKEMSRRTYTSVYMEDFITSGWERVAACRKPIVAAVSGIAFGGGCELAMMCDFVLASDTARFSLAEILVGTIGGTQRLTRSIGKSKAMEMVLTGREMTAAEAERSGAVSRVLPVADLLDEAVGTAERIAVLSRPVVMMAKECVNRAYETSLQEGIRFERRVFHASFALEDRSEGMMAFMERRPPRFTHR